MAYRERIEMKSIRGAAFRKTQSLRSFFNELDHAELKQFCQALFMDPAKTAQRVYTGQSQGRQLVSHMGQAQSLFFSLSHKGRGSG